MEIDWRKYIRKKTVSELVSELDENNNFDDFINNPLIKTKSIKEYFNNSNIFVTGASGFLGKVLIEKLLRSCVGISKIYILLRPKRGLGSDQRFKEFLKNKIFDRIHEKTPEVLNKLICIPGEINEPNIGLTEKDSITLQDRIDIVFHVAATVRFNEPLRDAANLNTFGTQRVMELCTKMKNLKVSCGLHCVTNLLHLKQILRNQSFSLELGACEYSLQQSILAECGRTSLRFNLRRRASDVYQWSWRFA